MVYSEYSPADCGCSLVAVDLKTGQRIWRSDLTAVGSCNHSAYSNRVTMKFADGHIFVYGDEGLGNYLEIVNFSTGTTVAHKVFPEAEQTFVRQPEVPPAPGAAVPEGLLWNDFPVIIARVLSATKLAPGAAKDASHTVVLEPFATVAGEFDISHKPLIEVRTRIDPASSSIRKSLAVGSMVLAVLHYAPFSGSQFDACFWIGPDKYDFMPHSAALIEITGADDKVVHETLVRIRKSRAMDDPAEEPEEN